MRDLPWSLHATSAPLGHKGVSDAKQIRDAGGIQTLHICPATGNLPTRMTEASWRRLCLDTQSKARERECIDKNQQYLMRMTRRLNVCAWCKGDTLPKGLEFITAAELAAMSKPQEEATAMARQSKMGVCENCGDKGALSGSHGQRVCSTCLKVRSAVNSHVERVAAAARHLGKGEELLAALVPEGGGLAIKITADFLQEISNLCGYEGEDPQGLVEAVRRVASGGAQQLTSEAEAGALRTIAGIVGYGGTDGEELVQAVRRWASAPASCGADIDCAECDAANALLEIADLVGKRGASSGLVVEAVRGLLNEPWPPSGSDQHRVDLLRACELELDDAVSASSRKDWSWAAAAAVQTIGELTNSRDDLLALLTRERADNARLYEEKINRANAAFLHTVGELKDEIGRLSNQTQSELEQVTQLRDELTRTGADVEQLRDQLNVASELNVRLRDRMQTSESRLIWYREALEVLRDRLGLDHLGEDEDVVEHMLEAIASQAQDLTRFQDLSRAADVRADHLEGELERQIGVNEAQAAVERELRATIAEQSADFERLRNQDLAANGRDWSTDDSPLLDVALAVIRDEPVPADRIATLIDLARRAAA